MLVIHIEAQKKLQIVEQAVIQISMNIETQIMYQYQIKKKNREDSRRIWINWYIFLLKLQLFYIFKEGVFMKKFL